MAHKPVIGEFRTHARRWVVMLAVSAALAGPAWGQAEGRDDSLRSYYTANGLLNRGLFEEAAAEYRAFLDSGPRGTEAATARYGLAVALSQLGRADEALDQLDGLDPPSGFQFRFESDLLRAQLLYGRAEFGRASEILGRLAQRSADHPHAHEAGGLWIECLYRAGEHEQAIRRASELLSDESLADRDLDLAALFAGLSLSAMGRDEEAAGLLDPVSKRRDELGHSAALSLAGVLLRLERAADAAALYEDLAALNDDRWSPQALLGAARIKRAAGAFRDAITLLERLAEGYQDSPALEEARLELGINLIESGQFDEGRAALPDHADSDGSPLASRSAYWHAKSLLREGDPAGAARALEAALDTFPGSPIIPEMLYDLGVALAEADQPAEAARVFSRVPRDFPGHRLAQTSRLAEATTRLRLGEFDQARETASRVDDDAPEAADAALVIAEADAALGRHEEVVDRLDRWLRANPDHPSADRARYRVSMSLAALGRLNEAEHAAGALLAEGRVEAELRPGLVVLGDAAFRDGDWERAERWYRRAVELQVDPLDVARLKLGLALARQDRHEDAHPLFEEAAAGPSGGETAEQAMFELGQARLMLGRDDEAAEAFERLLERSPDSRFAAYSMRQLGSIAERAGDAGGAADWYERAAGAGGDTAADSRRDQARAALAAGKYDIPARLASEWEDPDLRAYAGMAAARGGDPDGAIKLLDDVLSSGGLSDDVRSSAVLERAWCARQLGDDDAALRSLRPLLDEDRADRYAVYAALEAASIDLDADRTEDAAEWLDRAGAILDAEPELAEPPMLAQLDYRLAQHAAATGQPERVIERLGTFREQHPVSELGPAANVLLGDAFIETRRPDRAAQAFEQAADSATGELRVTALLRLGDAHARAESWAASREVFERFLADYADSPFAFEAEFGRAWALEHEGEHEQARAGYSKVVASHEGPTAARAQFQIGECLFAEGRLEEAVRELLRVDILYDYPEWSAAALYDAGRAFEQLRKFGEARQQYRDVVGRFGDSDWASLAGDRLEALSAGDG